VSGIELIAAALGGTAAAGATVAVPGIAGAATIVPATAASSITAGTILSGLGTAASAIGTIGAGTAAKNAAEYEAKQMEIKGAEERAAAQRDAQQKRREGQLVQSRQQALAAASGAGAGFDAPTIVKMMTDTAGESEYNAQTAMYGGLSRATGLMDSARGRRAAGKASFLGSVIGGFGSAASGFAKLRPPEDGAEIMRSRKRIF
jgi:hypothetical protein